MTSARLLVGTALAILASGCFSVSREPSAAQPPSRALPDHVADWTGAAWITASAGRADVAETDQPAGGASAFVRAIVNEKPVTHAVITASALGIFDVYVNASRVGREVLKTGFTADVRERQAFSWEVTPLFNSEVGATNLVTIIVSPRWQKDSVAGFQSCRCALLAQIELSYEDGTTACFPTDRSWRAGVGGPLLRSGCFEGEAYDARRRINLSSLGAAESGEAFAGQIVPPRGPTFCRRTEQALRPTTAYVRKGVVGAGEQTFGRVLRLRDYTNASLIDLDPAETLVVDFGRTIEAIPYFKAIAEAGTRLTIFPGESLNGANGNRAEGNDGPEDSVRYADGKDGPGGRLDYTFGGCDIESYWPQTTFFKYRYLTITADRPVKFTRLQSVPIAAELPENARGERNAM